MSEVKVVKCDGCGKILDTNQPGIIFTRTDGPAYIMVNNSDSDMKNGGSRGLSIQDRHFCNTDCIRQFVYKIINVL